MSLLARNSLITLKSTPLMRSRVGPSALKTWNRGIGFGAPTHGPVSTKNDHLPFDFQNKKAFTIKYVAYLGAGFALPWIAIWWHWHRPGGLKNP